MDPTTMFWFFVIFAIIGFITDMIFGLDVYKLYSDIGAIIFVSVISLFVIQVSNNPQESLIIVEKMINHLVDNLIPMVIGDAAGTFVSNIVKSIKDLF